MAEHFFFFFLLEMCCGVFCFILYVSHLALGHSMYVCVKAHTFSKCISKSKIIFDSIISVRIMDVLLQVTSGTTKKEVFSLLNQQGTEMTIRTRYCSGQFVFNSLLGSKSKPNFS